MADRLTEAAEVIADGARRRSAWSTRIPASVHTVSAGGDTVLIEPLRSQAEALRPQIKGLL